MPRHESSRRQRFAVATLAMTIALAACNRSPDVTATTPSSGYIDNIAVPMRDGVVLRADVYLPPGAGPFPTLVYRTPYGKSGAAEAYETHAHAVARGYAVVLQDVRGRYASDGDFDPYRHEQADGYDTIEWAAAQSWSNGAVGTYGLSYPGAVQWLAAMASPPHLKAMVPAMTFSSPRNFFYMNGVFDLSWLPWIYTNIAPDRRARLDLPGIRSDSEADRAWPQVAQEYTAFRPLAELPYLQQEAPYYFAWLQHPPEDSWWDWAELRGHYDRTDAAVLNLSGWYDEAYGPEGAVTNFRGLIDARASLPNARTHLMLGPWTHGVGATMRGKVGDLDFGADAAIDYDGVVLDFFDHYLRGIDNAYANAPAVRYFVMGANRWQSSSHWPPAGARTLTLYFNDADVRGRGTLGRQPPENDTAPSRFLSVPETPVTDRYEAFGPHDYAYIAERDDVLTFDSEVLEAPLTIAGTISAHIFAACDCRDFDLWLRLQDLYPDGRAINLMGPGNDVLRASYREPSAGRQTLAPGEVYELAFPALNTALQLGRGHRLRAQLSASFAPHLSGNLQTGESETDASISKAATISVHHGGGQVSRLLLPVIDGQ